MLTRLRKPSRSPHGERGLKLNYDTGLPKARGRSPHGERGLKSFLGFSVTNADDVALLMESVD